MGTAAEACVNTMALAADEIERLRQGIWDAYRILGFDTDGDPTPAALVYPPLWDLIRGAATEQRKDYNDALDELHSTLWGEIVAERKRAHAKHGATSMESCDPMADRRLRVLTEEVGEVARVLNDREHDIAKGEYLAEARAHADLRSELIQVAAMAVAWIAALDGEALA